VKPFRRTRGAYVARLTDDERRVLAGVASDVADLLADDVDDEPDDDRPDDDRPDDDRLDALARELAAPVRRPQDPAVHRLLPDASRDDPALADEFRRLTQADLRDTKAAGLRLLARTLTARDGNRPSHVVVAPADARPVAAAMTDVRLVLAERLGIRTDEDAEAIYTTDPVTAQRAQLVAVYGALSWLQESLVTLMLDDARNGVDVTPRGGAGPQASG